MILNKMLVRAIEIIVSIGAGCAVGYILAQHQYNGTAGIDITSAIDGQVVLQHKAVDIKITAFQHDSSYEIDIMPHVSDGANLFRFIAHEESGRLASTIIRVPNDNRAIFLLDFDVDGRPDYWTSKEWYDREDLAEVQVLLSGHE